MRLEARSFKARLLHGVAWATLAKVVQIVCGLLVMALVTRLLAPGDVGVFHVALNAVVVLGIVANLGFEQVALQKLPALSTPPRGGLRDRLLRRTAALVLAATLTVAALYVFVGHERVFARFVDRPGLAVLGLPIGLWVLGGALQRFVGEAYRGLHRIRESVLFGGVVQFGGMIVYLGLSAGLLVLLLASGRASIATVVWLSASTAIVASAVGLALLLRPAREGTSGERQSLPLAALAAPAAPFLVNSLAQYFSKRSDIWIAGAMMADEATGLYATVAVLPALINLPLTNANVVLAPAIGELYAQGKIEKLKRLVGLGAGLALVPASLLAVVFVVAGRGVLGLAFGDYYAAGAIVLAVLVVGQLTSVGVGSSGYVLMMAGRHVDLMACSIFGAVATVLGCVVGASIAGLTGLAVGAAAGASAQQLSKLFMVRVRLGFWAHARPIRAVRAFVREGWRLREAREGSSQSGGRE